MKPQYVDHIPKAVKGNVQEVLSQKDERSLKEDLCKDLDLVQVLDRDVGDVSGGELQRFAIAVVAIRHAEISIFDEPSSYLDVKQRLKAAQVIRSLPRLHRLELAQAGYMHTRSCWCRRLAHNRLLRWNGQIVDGDRGVRCLHNLIRKSSLQIKRSWKWCCRTLTPWISSE